MITHRSEVISLNDLSHIPLVTSIITPPCVSLTHNSQILPPNDLTPYPTSNRYYHLMLLPLPPRSQVSSPGDLIWTPLRRNLPISIAIHMKISKQNVPSRFCNLFGYPPPHPLTFTPFSPPCPYPLLLATMAYHVILSKTNEFVGVQINKKNVQCLEKVVKTTRSFE